MRWNHICQSTNTVWNRLSFFFFLSIERNYSWMTQYSETAWINLCSFLGKVFRRNNQIYNLAEIKFLVLFYNIWQQNELRMIIWHRNCIQKNYGHLTCTTHFYILWNTKSEQIFFGGVVLVSVIQNSNLSFEKQ